MRKNQLAETYFQASLTKPLLVSWSSNGVCESEVPLGKWCAGVVHSATNQVLTGEAKLIRVVADVSPVDAIYHMRVLVFNQAGQFITQMEIKNRSGGIDCREIDVFMRGIPLDVKIRLIFQLVSPNSDVAFVARTQVSVLA